MLDILNPVAEVLGVKLTNASKAGQLFSSKDELLSAVKELPEYYLGGIVHFLNCNESITFWIHSEMLLNAPGLLFKFQHSKHIISVFILFRAGCYFLNNYYYFNVSVDYFPFFYFPFV